MNEVYILSGSEDGTVRIWARTTHQLLTQFTHNRKTITRVLPDVQEPHLIHICGLDRIISTVDLQQERKIVHHEIGSGTLQDMTQRKDSEHELVTCGLGNAILFWDCDEANPIAQIPFAGQLNAIQMSPSGRFIAAGSANSELYIYNVQ
jgi:WD40 repeat protein